MPAALQRRRRILQEAFGPRLKMPVDLLFGPETQDLPVTDRRHDVSRQTSTRSACLASRDRVRLPRLARRLGGVDPQAVGRRPASGLSPRSGPCRAGLPICGESKLPSGREARVFVVSALAAAAARQSSPGTAGIAAAGDACVAGSGTPRGGGKARTAPSGLIDSSSKGRRGSPRRPGWGRWRWGEAAPVTAPATMAYLNSGRRPPPGTPGRSARRCRSRRSGPWPGSSARWARRPPGRAGPPLLHPAQDDQPRQEEGHQQPFPQDEAVLVGLGLP